MVPPHVHLARVQPLVHLDRHNRRRVIAVAIPRVPAAIAPNPSPFLVVDRRRRRLLPRNVVVCLARTSCPVQNVERITERIGRALTRQGASGMVRRVSTAVLLAPAPATEQEDRKPQECQQHHGYHCKHTGHSAFVVKERRLLVVIRDCSGVGGGWTRLGIGGGGRGSRAR